VTFGFLDAWRASVRVVHGGVRGLRGFVVVVERLLVG
jgi:hypothetical protein